MSLVKGLLKYSCVEALQNAEAGDGRAGRSSGPVCVCRHGPEQGVPLRNHVWGSAVSQSLGTEGDSQNPENLDSPRPAARVASSGHGPAGSQSRPGLCFCTSTAAQPTRRVWGLPPKTNAVLKVAASTSRGFARGSCALGNRGGDQLCKKMVLVVGHS